MVCCMCPPPGAMMTAQPVAWSLAGRNGVRFGLWTLERTGKTMSGSCRQLISSGSFLRASEPGAPSAQSGMAAGWADSVAGAAVGDMGALASDPDAPDTRAFAILAQENTTAGRQPFIINATSGVISVASPTPDLDYERKGSYALTVGVTDKGGLAANASVRVTLANDNEAPVWSAVPQLFARALEVQDVGQAIHRDYVEGQLHGGTAQGEGFGQAVHGEDGVAHQLGVFLEKFRIERDRDELPGTVDLDLHRAAAAGDLEFLGVELRLQRLDAALHLFRLFNEFAETCHGDVGLGVFAAGPAA